MPPARSTRRFWSRRKARLRRFGHCWRCSRRRACRSSLYTDRGSHYFFTPKAGEAVDKERLTQVGRALMRLGIEHMPAYSPEARGRSERMFGTLQDRLPKELALAGITRHRGRQSLSPRGLSARSTTRRFARPPQIAGERLRDGARSGTPWPRFCASRRSGSSRATTRSSYEGRHAAAAAKPSCAPTTSRPTSRCVSIRMARSRCSTARAASRATRAQGVMRSPRSRLRAA